MWKVAIKKLRLIFAWKLAWYTPLKLDTIDQVWPENFGEFYKAPAVGLVSVVYMGVQEDDE
jgi:hypothetical protein